MDNEIKTWLYDILNAIVEIQSFFDNEQPDLNIYQKDIRTKRAVERNIEIIGEALNRILKKSDSIIISHARQIVDTRNRIIHGYDSVSDEAILGIVITYIPLLKSEINTILGE